MHLASFDGNGNSRGGDSMITNLLRRLQGRSARLAPSPEPDVPASGHATDREGIAYSLDAPELEQRFLAWVFDLPDGDGVRDVDAAEAAFAHLQVVAQRFDVRRMPRLPAVVPQLLAAMRREDSDAAQAASLLARDPTLAGDVMRVANSVFHRRAQAPAGLQQAVQALGNEGLRHVVLGSVMRPILRGDAGHPGFTGATRLWAQAEARAWLCGRLAAGRDDAGDAHLAGIVAGTGVAALSRMVPGSLLADAAGDPAFATRFLAIARPLALRAGAHWQLPATVLDALQGVPAPDADAASLACTLQAADRLAMGYRLIEAGCLAGDAAWPNGSREYDAPASRAPLFVALSREVEALDPASAAA